MNKPSRPSRDTAMLWVGLMIALLGSSCGGRERQSGDATGAQNPGQSTAGTGASAGHTAHGANGPELLAKDLLDAEVKAQKRVAAFFHDKVTPRLAGCWGSLAGSGDIRMEYTFARRDNSWMHESTTLAHSTLAEDQNDAALRCMEGVMKDAALPIDSADGDTKELFISWSWPVPFPKDAEQQYQTMLISTGGGGVWGCDGRGTPAKCKRCVGSGASSCCVTVCVGYVSCGFSKVGGKVVGCFNDPPTQCVSGGQGGVSGGLIMF